MIHRLQIAGMEFEIRRSSRRHTLGLTVDRSGALVAHSPVETSTEDLVRWIRGKLVWVHRKLALKQAVLSHTRAPEYVSGESFYYLGHRYGMKLVNRQEQPLEFDGTSFTLRRNARPAEAHFRRWYIAEGSEWLKRRTTMLSRRTGASPARVEVRELGFRWGSCGKNGVLYFNWRILQLPARLIDYVIVHELVHLRERHHGPAFSAAIERAMPNWEDRKSALNRKAQEFLMFGLTSGDC